MKFTFIPKANYSIGETITVNNSKWIVESYSFTGKNIIVKNGVKRLLCIFITDDQIIVGEPA